MPALHCLRRAAARIGIAATMAVLVGVVPAVHALATGTPSPPSPAAGHSEVVAQSVIEFDGGAYHWALVHESVEPDAGDVALVPGGPSFLVASGGVLVIGDAGGTGQVRLASGEATFLVAGGESAMWADGGEPSYYAIELVGGESSSDAASSERSFSVGEGNRDVDLIRDVVSSGETLMISANESVPVLVVVTDGAVNVASAGGAEDSAIGAGEVILVDGALAITPIGAEPAAVIAAVIGPMVERDSDVPPTTSTSDISPSAGTTVGGSTTSTPGPTSSTVPSASTTTTGPMSNDTGTVLVVLPTIPTDFDGDGLSGAEEADIGTNPSLADTDGDGLIDGDEKAFGSSPLHADRDGDGLIDFWEWQFGTRPNDEDTDDDAVSDGAEIAAGTNPSDPNSF